MTPDGRVTNSVTIQFPPPLITDVISPPGGVFTSGGVVTVMGENFGGKNTVVDFDGEIIQAISSITDGVSVYIVNLTAGSASENHTIQLIVDGQSGTWTEFQYAPPQVQINSFFFFFWGGGGFIYLCIFPMRIF